MKTENKPCPFCGKPLDLDDPDTLYPSGIYWGNCDGYRVYRRMKDRLPTDLPCWEINCAETSGGCGVEINADSREEALAKWNTRSIK